MKVSTRNLLIYILLFIFVAAFPIDLINTTELNKGLIMIALRLVLLSYFVYELIRNRVKIFGLTNFVNLLFCIPLALCWFSNLISASINGCFKTPSFDAALFVVTIALCLINVITEEIVFRLFLQNQFTNATPIKRILFSALVFSLMHLINLANVSSIDALITVVVQVVYNFGLGLILGFIFEYSHSLVSCVIFHFGFNLFNSILIQYYQVSIDQITFYVTAVIIALVLAIYLLLVYKFIFKKYIKYYK